MDAAQRSILVVEDDELTRTFLADQLAADGFRVAAAAGAGEALRALEVRRPDAVLLDLALEDGHGLQVLDRVRAADGGSRIDPDTPVVVLSGRCGEADRIRGLVRGADDYVCKPFSYAELLARLRAVLRRATPRRARGLVRVGDLTIDPATRSVRLGGSPVTLSAKEFALLHALASDPARVYPKGGAAARRVGLPGHGRDADRRHPRLPAAPQAVGRRRSLRGERARSRLPADGGGVSALGAAGWALAAGLGARCASLEAGRAASGDAEHELRGALTAFALALGPAGPDSGALAGALESELERARAALADLSAARGGKHGRGPLARRGEPAETFSLERLARSAATAWQPAARARGRRVELEWRAGPARVRANRGRLAQALGNLLANAVEHGSGPVRIRATHAGRRVRLEVVNGTAPARPDRGRGLRIATRAVEQCGGTLTFARGLQRARAAIELPLSS